MFDIVLSMHGRSVSAQGQMGGAWTKAHTLDPEFSIEQLEAFTAKVGSAAQYARSFDNSLLDMAHALHEALFQGDLLDKLTRASERAGDTLVVRLIIEDARLQKVPWEALCKPGTSADFLATGTRLQVVRGITSTVPVKPRHVDGALRILVIAPQGPEISVNALKLAAGQSKAIEWLDPFVGASATWANVSRRLRTGLRPHVIHFLGHGGLDNQGHPALRFADDDDGDEVWIKAETLAHEVKANLADELRLIVLEACEGAAPGLFGSAAQILVRADVESVISYLWPVRAAASLGASKAFYETLTAGQTARGNVLASVSAARRTLLAESAAGFSLLLHVRNASPVVFDFASATERAPFTVPFQQDKRFLGRDDDLKKLHELLQADAAIGVGALTGMGGIGKTQLAVEYAYRYREAYRGGVYWVNAARDWLEEFARLAGKVGIRDQSVAEYERLRWLARAFVEHLAKQPKSLVIFDNVEDPLELQNRSREFVPVDLPCRLLFTTRRQTDAFPMVEIHSLDDDSALQLLLNTATRKQLLEAGSLEDRSTARSICKTLGNLPLAIALASAYLEKRPNVPLQAYLKGLTADGALLVLDGAKVDPRQLPTQHAQGLRATLQEQWAALRDDGDARAVLQTAALLGEAEQIPRARLSLLTGLADERSDWRDPPLDEALRELSEWSLVETLSESAIRLHPLVREFAVGNLGANKEAFAQACAARMADALYDMERLSNEVERRGVDEVLYDVRAGVLLGEHSERCRLETLQRPLDREAHLLGRWNLREMPALFLQRLRNRSFELGIEAVWRRAEDNLLEKKHSWLRERFLVGSESNALVRTLVGHTDAVRGVAITPDGRFIVSASDDGTCRLWNFHDGRCIRTFKEHSASVQGIAVSPDGRLAVLAFWNGTLRVWDIGTGVTIRVLMEHSAGVTSVCIPPNARFMVSTSCDHTVKIWDLHTGALLQTLMGHGRTVTSTAVTPDQRFLISASFDQNLKLWSLASGDCIRDFVEKHGSVHAVAITPMGRHVVAGYDDGVLIVWEIETGQSTQTLKGHMGRVTSIAITPDGHCIVSGSYDGTIRIWDLDTGGSIDVYQGHSKEVQAVVLTRDGRFAISVSADNTVKIWDLEMANVDLKDMIAEKHTAAIRCVACSPDGQFALTGSKDTNVKLWHLSSGRVARTFGAHDDVVNAVAITPDGRLGVSASDDFQIRIWELETGKLVNVFKVYDQVYDVATTPDGRQAITASFQKTLTMWEIETGTVQRTLHGHQSWVIRVVVTPNGCQAISASNDRTLRIWDLDTGQTARVLRGHLKLVSAVAVTPDGNLAISGSADCCIKLWNISSGQTIRTIEGHIQPVHDVAITSDGQFIVSVSSDRTLRIWHLETGTQVAILEAHAPLLCCAVSPDGKTILAGDQAGGLHILDWHRGDLRLTQQPQ